MLPPENRLRLTRDHRMTARCGARGAGRLVVVHVITAAPGDSGRPTRAGFVVGRAVGGAVTRNTVRRRLRHVMRDRLDRLPAGSLIVVRARAEAASVPSTTLARDVDEALNRVLSRDEPSTSRAGHRGQGKSAGSPYPPARSAPSGGRS